MNIETLKFVLEAGGLGVAVLVLLGLYSLTKTFAPQFISAWVSLTSTLAKLGEQIDNFGVMVTGLGVKVDAARDRASAGAQEAIATREALHRTGSFPAVTAQGAAAGAPGAAPPQQPHP